MGSPEGRAPALFETLVFPLPERLVTRSLEYAWMIVAINVVGTAFGFWYYRFQLAATPLPIWPWVPDSPTATLFMAASLGLWKLGRPNELVNMLAYYGNITLGLWTPYVLVLFASEFGHSRPMFAFLFGSHLLMVVQAFLVSYYSEFPAWSIVAAVLWYSTDLLLDFFIPILGRTPHHTWIPVVRSTELWFNASALDLIAAGGVLLTIWTTVVAFLTRLAKERESSTPEPRS